MDGISGIDSSRFNGGLDMVSGGVRPDQMNDPKNSFSRLLDEASNREKAAAAVPAADPGAEPRLIPRQTRIDKTDKLYEQCRELETFLAKNILNAMRKNVMKSSLIDTGYAGEIYEDMLWDEYAKEYAKNAGFGLADLAYLELTGQRGRKG